MNLFGLQRITANQLAEIIGSVSGRSPQRAHFVKDNARACRRSLKSRLTAGESAPNDMNRLQPSV